MTSNPLFVPPAAEGLPLPALDSATEGADRLDAMALSPYGRNLLAHALVQLARDGWLRSEPGEGFEPVRDRETPEPESAPAASPVGQPTRADAALRDRIADTVRAMADEHPTNAAWVQDCHTIADRLQDAAPAVFPGPPSRAAGQDEVDRLAEWLWDNCAEDERSGLLADDPRRIATVALHWPELRRVADEEQPAEARTPCSQPNPCEDGELCATHEEEQAHADGEHEYCGVTCEVQFSSEQMRNFILAKGYPGTAGMLAELERRAAAGRPAEAQQQPETEARPARGDQFEAWLKAQRDEHPRSSHAWFMVDCVLDTYRLHADTGTPLGEHVCEGQAVGDCEHLEPAPVEPAAADSEETPS